MSQPTHLDKTTHCKIWIEEGQMNLSTNAEGCRYATSSRFGAFKICFILQGNWVTHVLGYTNATEKCVRREHTCANLQGHDENTLGNGEA